MWTEIRNAQPVNKKIRKVVTDTANSLIVDGHPLLLEIDVIIYLKEFGLLGVSSATTDITKGKVNRIGGKFHLKPHQQHIYINTMFTQAEIEFVNTDGSPIGAGITSDSRYW